GCLQFLGVPWVWQLGDCIPRVLCSTELTPLSGLAETFTQQIRGTYIVVSEQLRRETEDCGLTLGDTVATIPYWISGPRPPARTGFYRGGRLRIMAAGQVARIKGTDILIESAAMLRDAGYRDFSVDVYGNLLDHSLVHMIRHLDLAEHVFLKGALPQAQLLEMYKSYDV